MNAPYQAIDCTFIYVPILLLTLAPSAIQAQQDIDREPIYYHTAKVADAIAHLQEMLDTGELELQWDDKHGWLPSLLELLEVPTSSQLLVFSKTSLQFAKITPHRPRAIYFNDNVYLGAVQYGDLVELSAVDPQQGAVFYSLKQNRTEKPQILRDRNKCLTCHHGHRTQDVPGYLIRSVFPGADGNPLYSLGSTTTDQTTDFRKRYGGWYVTGQHGELRHRGNMIAKEESISLFDLNTGANLDDLGSLVSTKPYLTPHSDLVALMVLEHQTQMHNFITKASYEARQTSHYDTTMNKLFERPANFQSDVSKRRIVSAGESLLQYLLFAGEFRLTSPVQGTSNFAQHFQSLGPRDSQGRSLRDLDLQTRLLKYPCSYLIYSESFDSLPSSIHQYIVGRLDEILSGDDTSAEYAHLTADDRMAIRTILIETKPNLAEALAN